MVPVSPPLPGLGQPPVFPQSPVFPQPPALLSPGHSSAAVPRLPQEVSRQLAGRQSQLAAARQTAAQLALSQCEQSVSSMMAELNTRWMEVTDRVQVSQQAKPTSPGH